MADSVGHFDETVDFLVAGSGAGGLTAALAAHARGLRTLIVEKNPQFGGSSALSGGGIWIPGAPAQARAGHKVDIEPVVGYLRAITKGIVPEERLRAYLATAPRMMEFLEGISTHTAFVWKPDYPDYFPETPGGSTRGNLINVEPIDLRALGSDEPLLLPPRAMAPKGVWIGPNELVHFYRLRQTWAGKAIFARLLWRMLRARLTGERVVTGGQALVARLILAIREQKIDLWLGTPLLGLISDTAGNVIGATVQRGDRTLRIGANHGVLLATGGFEHNPAMRKKYQPTGNADVSMGNPANTGDGIRAAETAGADLSIMDSAWWYPAIAWGKGAAQMSLNERMMPAQIIVNGAGERYINEATPYSEFGFAMIAGQSGGVPHIPSWLITDDWSWRRYVIFGHLPLPRIPFAPAPTGRGLPAHWQKSASVVTAGSVDELADRLGLPRDALARTVARYNSQASAGHDDDFGRGDSAYDRLYGDITLARPNLAPLHGPPYYAFRLTLSDLGTNGGIVTDGFARALRPDGSVIGGLFATGNVSAAVMGRSYAGAGATLGPAMTFGYIAANTAADHAQRPGVRVEAGQRKAHRP